MSKWFQGEQAVGIALGGLYNYTQIRTSVPMVEESVSGLTLKIFDSADKDCMTPASVTTYTEPQ